MQEQDRGRRAFVWLLATFGGVKALIVVLLPLFVDEAFYWQESRHLAWVYSDLPGLTAWLIRLGTALAGHEVWAVRLLFFLIGGLLPYLIVCLARAAGAARPWQSGLMALLFPLATMLGLLALPDTVLALACVMCLMGGVQAVQGRARRAAFWLGLGLVLGALAHYRFVAVIGAGFAALLVLPEGRRALRQPWLWLAIGAGALAWLPVVLWNLGHDSAGLRFQFVERHPWRFQIEGLRFVVLQIVIATPLLFVAMLKAVAGIRQMTSGALRWLTLAAALTLFGFLALGFFADVERVSFHWPLPAWLAFFVVLPIAIERWRRVWQRLTWGSLALCAVLVLGGHLWVSLPQGRAALAGSALYPDNFAAWDEIAAVTRQTLARLPPGARVIADHFKLGAQLGFALGDADIAVLDHPLNHRHGRAVQLQEWGLVHDGSRTHWHVLVVGVRDVKFSALLARFQALCAHLGPLPAPQLVDVDAGERRFAVFVLPPGRPEGACVTPAIAHVDSPQNGDQSGPQLLLRGWAIKDEVGIARVRVHANGRVLGEARYGIENGFVEGFWRGASRDPNLPAVQFEAEIQWPPGSRGWQQIELELHGGDGRIERWPGPRVRVREE